MNFATLKGLTIPKGKVTKITDASGRVLWSAVKKVSVTIGAKAVGDYDTVGTCWVDNVKQQNNTTIMVAPSSVLEVDIGTGSGYGMAGSTTARVYLNGVSVFFQTFRNTAESVRYQINLEGVSSVNIWWTARLANSNSDCDVYDCYITTT